ncbi:MAG: S41 family peptidase [Bryobacteraceae bacterium]|nr:S41 family peptidase [Bryobacteraceae bacterium]
MFALPALLILAAAPVGADLEQHLKRFIDVFATVQSEAADPVDPGYAFYGGAIPGMLRRLDPHSVFLDPDQLLQLQEMERSTRKGFGSVVSLLPGRVTVLQTLPGTPSARSGLGPGDEILAINGIRLDRLSFDQLIGLLSESRRRAVMLDVRKPGNARLVQIQMSPADVATQSVDLAFALQDGVGYVRVKSFEAETGRQLKEKIEQLGGASLRGLILDLRDNPGGLMPAALETAALFLAPGTKIVSVRGRGTEKEEIKVPTVFKAYDFPLAVLIDEKSASGSEIVAGALQDHDRAAVVGRPSYGKGLVQSVFPLSESTALALTTAYYYTPSGRSIQKPLEGAQIDGRGGAAGGGHYATDAGRPLEGGGGIRPDYAALPEPVTRLRLALEATGAYTVFATEALRKLRVTSPDWEVPPSLLDEFQAFLAQRNIQPGVAEWSADRAWIQSRLKQEIFNQTLGVQSGDEVEMRRDAEVRKALEVVTAAKRE